MKSSKIGIWSLIASLDVLSALVDSQPDFIIFDLEHGSWDQTNLPHAVHLCEVNNIFSIIRVPSPDVFHLQPAFDCKPDAIQVSGLTKKSDYINLISNSSLRPKGNLGFSPWTRVGFNFKNSKKIQDPKIVPQVETRQGLVDFLELSSEEIAHFFGVFLGRYDLSIDLEAPGNISDPFILESLKSLSSKAIDCEISLMSVSNSVEDSKVLREIGVGWISIGSDHTRLRQRPTN